ncbi:MAG: hypothetical protein AB1898_20830 [Acidobacteriota bacterium]
MSRRASQIGFSQRVRLEWLDQTANLVLAGSDKSGVNSALIETLKDKVSVGGKAQRGNREKIITILMKVWVTTPPELRSLQREGLELLKHLPLSDHMAVHWGMIMAVYPFWSGLATQVGRLLRLQGTAAAAHVQRRVREQYGERETVARAARRVLRSYLDWGVLEESGEMGLYKPGLRLTIDNPALTCWLMEASLHGQSKGGAGIRDLLESPTLFPFRFRPVSVNDVMSLSSGLECTRHGLDEDIVMLRKATAIRAARVGS